MTLAVGGCAAGQNIDSEHDYARAMQVKPVDIRRNFNPNDMVGPTVETSFYRKLELSVHVKGERFGFLFFVDEKSINTEYDLIRELIAGYRPVTVRSL